MDEIIVESGLDLSAQEISTTLTEDLAGVSDALVALAIASAVAAIIITVIRLFLSDADDGGKTSAALSRIIRIAMIVSAIAFIGYCGIDLAYMLGWTGM